MMTRSVVLSLLVSAALAAPAAAQVSTPSPAPPAGQQAPASMPDDRTAQDRTGDDAKAAAAAGVDWTGEARRVAAPGFDRIFRDLGHDFVSLPTRENALLVGIGAGLAGFAARNDRGLTSSMHGSRDARGFFGPGAYIGNFYINLGASFATYAVGRATGHGKLAQVGADLARAQMVSQATTQGIKYFANRTRPNGDARSFPSGHTSSAFATATVLQRHYGWKVGIPAYALAGYVGASRMADNKHYLSDVAFGAALGIVAGRTVTIGVGSTKFALTPIAANGGVGIGFTKVIKK